MCAVAEAQMILDALQARINNQSVFSAFDVTTDARDKTQENIEHMDVRNIVHNEFNTNQFPANYRRATIVLKVENNPSCFIYYPDNKDPHDHPETLQPSTAPTPAPALSINPNQSMAPAGTSKKGGKVKNDDGTYTCTATAEGRVELPEKLLSQITAQGTTYDVVINSKVVYKATDNKGRVRVSKRDLGSDGPFTVSVDVSANTIKIESA